MSIAPVSISPYQLMILDSKTVDKITNEAYHELNHNTINRTNVKDVTTDITDIQNGNRIQGRAYDFSNHFNAGHESFGLQNLGFLGDLSGAVGAGAQLTGAVWQAVDADDYKKNGAGVINGINAGTGAVTGIDDQFGFSQMTGMDDMANSWGWMNLRQKPQLQNLGFLGDFTKMVDAGAQATGAVWSAVDDKDY